MSDRTATTPPEQAAPPAAVHSWTALLLQAQGGDRQAFARLVAEAEKPLFGFIHRKVRNVHATEDLLADTFLKAWRTLPSYKSSRCQGNTWLFMVARRLVIDYLRKKGRRGETQLEPDGAGADGPIDRRGDSLEDREHAAAVVRKALEKLPDRYAEAIDLMYLQGLDRHEIAIVLGCSVNAASSLLTRARDRMQEELKALDL